MTAVAMVGTGRMGAAMVGRLTGAGHEVVAYNRTRERAEALGVPVADTPREAVSGAEVVLVSLADDAAVGAVYPGDDGLAAGLVPGAVVLETSTIHPDTVRALAPLVADRGATLLDSPVSGSVSVVERGQLTVMAGGDSAALDRARPVLAAFAARVFHLGGLGSGAVMKLVVNSVVHGLNQALCEALVLAEKAGLDRSTTYDVLAESAVSAPFVHYKRAAFEHPEDTPAAFMLDLVAKDLALIDDLAGAVRARMDQLAANRAVVADAVAAGYGTRDLSALADFLR
jgi:3-hydroxyisobutyrate dehydrogenase/2-hydroxy-3-oxopropionate reductase